MGHAQSLTAKELSTFHPLVFRWETLIAGQPVLDLRAPLVQRAFSS